MKGDKVYTFRDSMNDLFAPKWFRCVASLVVFGVVIGLTFFAIDALPVHDTGKVAIANGLMWPIFALGLWFGFWTGDGR